MDAFVAIFVIIIVAFIYFLPAIVASDRKSKSAGAVFVLNLLLGWTFLGWVIALVWALAGESGKAKASSGTGGFASSPSARSEDDQLRPIRTLKQDLNDLDELLAAGRITKEQHERKKQQLLA